MQRRGERLLLGSLLGPQQEAALCFQAVCTDIFPELKKKKKELQFKEKTAKIGDALQVLVDIATAVPLFFK